jgi:hypothetical protein
MLKGVLMRKKRQSLAPWMLGLKRIVFRLSLSRKLYNSQV